MSQPTPGTPSLLRAINDRAALEVMLDRGPLTRAELAAVTGISKPTASQLLTRLQRAGLVVAGGLREGGPGRTAELYAVNPRAAYVAGVGVTSARIAVKVAGLTGEVLGEHVLPTPGRAAGDVVARLRTALTEALGPLRVTDLNRVVIGIGGAVNPATGRLTYAAHIPGWHIPRLVQTLSDGLGVRVQVENDVNLIAQAEQAHGVAAGESDFVVLWVGEGIGLASVIGGRLHRGATGGAGEVGYMPLPGAPTARELGRSANHGMQALVGGPAVHRIMRAHGFRGHGPAEAVRAAVRALDEHGPADRRARAGAALDEVAARVATGLTSIITVVDPALVVLTGGVLLGGGEALRARVERELHTMSLARPPLRLSALGPEPVLDGALALALRRAQDELFASTVPAAAT
ncbi:ROK family transcriptional regulator [Bailinhaonella thermotolerans]|uniref:ROK family transcriptional regulator n=1 Tax=Bailinhaonella thermotolerans TaxID=1070861 RepID=A0A3A4B2K9_9ACTN|nr:ROK family transcriptional regulator [Bailinhaonella thermotolerans]RJL35391.1 ROK family transcriptional regulator [Bailinhaonella thermotolerans]